MAMRLLLATDGSAGASTATDLVAGLPWPTETTADVVRVVDPIPSTWAYAPIPDLQAFHEQLMAEAQQEVDAIASRLRGKGLHATGHVLLGSEAPALVHRATQTHVDLVVCGSRGRGHLASVVLGSVSAEVAATAPCSVLVARHPTVSSVVLAVDGSASAIAAEHLVRELPMFAEAALDLVTVTGPPTGAVDDWEAHVRLLGGLQHAVGDRLRDSGRTPHEVLLTGRPAHEIIHQARRSLVDLVVLGAHAQTGLDRLLLGSTTLEVLTHSPSSVLVAREPAFRVTDTAHAVPGELALV
jgi:nucleotide-binding universal stress UspA family protein